MSSGLSWSAATRKVFELALLKLAHWMGQLLVRNEMVSAMGLELGLTSLEIRMAQLMEAQLDVW